MMTRVRDRKEVSAAIHNDMTMTASTTMEERTAAAAWTAELSQAGHDISQAARRLQTSFHDKSEKAIQKG
jgi:hypothetical protein